VVANACGTSDCTTGNVGVLLGKGDGTFPRPVTYDPEVVVTRINRGGGEFFGFGEWVWGWTASLT